MCWFVLLCLLFYNLSPRPLLIHFWLTVWFIWESFWTSWATLGRSWGVLGGLGKVLGGSWEGLGPKGPQPSKNGLGESVVGTCFRLFYIRELLFNALFHVLLSSLVLSVRAFPCLCCRIFSEKRGSETKHMNEDKETGQKNDLAFISIYKHTKTTMWAICADLHSKYSVWRVGGWGCHRNGVAKGMGLPYR